MNHLLQASVAPDVKSMVKCGFGALIAATAIVDAMRDFEDAVTNGVDAPY